MKKVIFLLLAAMLLLGCCSFAGAEAAAAAQPKYVFLFIGDGMTFSQFQLASSYLGDEKHLYGVRFELAFPQLIQELGM